MRVKIESLVRKAGRIARKGFGESKKVEYKTGREMVTRYDREIEKFLKSELKKKFPEDGFLGEEGDKTKKKSYWIVDPIDGTTNFVFGVPFFSISVAHFNGKEIDAGVVFNPITNQMYSAEKGKGAFLNGSRIHVSSNSKLKNAYLCHCYTSSKKSREEAGKLAELLYTRAADLRRLGSASLELALVAEGKTDGFFQTGVIIWDVAAGVLLVREAGGKTEDFQGREFSVKSAGLWAYNSKLKMGRCFKKAGIRK